MKKNSKNEKSNLARRKLLKSAAVGGGVVVGAKSLSGDWAKPVIDQVILPAHAQMTQVFATGVFTSTVNIVTNSFPSSNSVQHVLLNALVSPAVAQSLEEKDHLVEAICDAGDDDTPVSVTTVYIRINEDNTVDVAVDITGYIGDDGPSCSASTTIAMDGAIADVSIQLDDDEFLNLTNMSASMTEVTGSWEAFIDDESCDNAFAATLGGSFPASLSLCNDD